jgi:hypothetical protein
VLVSLVVRVEDPENARLGAWVKRSDDIGGALPSQAR